MSMGGWRYRAEVGSPAGTWADGARGWDMNVF